MTKKKSKKVAALPPRVRAHGSGFRGVMTLLGRRVYGPTFDTVDDALSWLASADSVDVNAGEALTLATSFKLLERDLRDTGAAEDTAAFYRRAHLELRTVLGGDTPLQAIDAKAIRYYIDKRRRRGVAMKTIVRKELGTLRRIVNLAKTAGVLGSDPFDRVKLPKVRGSRYDSISAADVEKALVTIREANADHADIIELVWRSSLRLAEASRVRVADIDLAGRRLWVRGKNVDRYRPVSDALVPVLQRLIARAGADGKLVSSKRKVENAFYRWKQRLELPAFSAHVLRHGFASDLLNRGVAPPLVASLMGHTGLRMLERYFHADDGALRDAAAALGQGTPRQQLPPPDPTGQDLQAGG